MAKKISADKYIKRRAEVVQIIIRIQKSLKDELQRESDRIGTSMTQFVEASVRYYIDKLNDKT